MPNQVIRPPTATEPEILAVQAEINEKIGTKVHRKTAFLIAVIARILQENQQFGKVTVRQVYYQLVSRAVIENSDNSYRNYGHHLTTGRKGGVLPWDAFEDRSRMFRKEPYPNYDIESEGTATEALTSWFRYALDPRVSKEYDLPRWKDQRHYVELWVEKDALAGFLSPLCEELGIVLVVSRGYTSYTFKQEARKRFYSKISDDHPRIPILLYLGDLDPSGYDIYRCLKEELDLCTVERLGLHPEDVAQFGLVPNVIKETDRRAKGFKKLYPELEDNVYELDALPPGELTARAREGVLKYFSQRILEKNQERVRHWRARFTDHQERIKEILKTSGIDLEN
jgi:hypothetical protein